MPETAAALGDSMASRAVAFIDFHFAFRPKRAAVAGQSRHLPKPSLIAASPMGKMAPVFEIARNRFCNTQGFPGKTMVAFLF
jgi:hypothetical protein